MNLLPNTYFPLFYQYPSLQNNQFQFVETFQTEENKKYIKLLESENRLLKQKVEILEQKLLRYQQQEHSSTEHVKKIKKVQKQRKAFKCQYPQCKRIYKSTLALNLHIKMKHNGGSIREREAYAKLIIECQRENRPKPQIKINFPPNFLEVRFSLMKNYRKRVEEREKMLKLEQ